VSGILQPERQIGLKRTFIFLGICLYLHTPRGAPDLTDDSLIVDTIFVEFQKRMRKFLPIAHRVMLADEDIPQSSD